MKKLLLIAAVIAGGVMASQAGVSVNIGVAFPSPRPVVVHRPPVYCAPPVYVAPPICAPYVVVPHRPVYYRPVYGYRHDDRRRDRWDDRRDGRRGHDHRRH